MKTGITGATGQLGRLVVEKLKQKTNADNLIALVRSPEKAADLGIEARAFDYTKPEALANALQGIDYLLLISGNEVGQRKTQHENIIRAAQKANIKWIVYTSLLYADTSSLSLAPEHLATEELLKSSGIPYTILRNGWYTENYTGSIPGALGAGAFIGSAGEGKISSAAREDYAEAAAVVLTSEGQQGKTYELAGDNAYTLKDLATEISRQTGKDIPYNNLAEEEYAGILKSVGLPEGLAQSIASWDVGVSKGDLFNDSKVLSKLIGHPTTPFTDTVKKALV
ncbi:SDR family oxidoreductase [Albibacterium bauzanense]|uniref:NAD(P)H dehydrogenase (Quinone) n=1 Tax=Albibacterium bauzanense TaxID=653929 RepID=A0A4R1M1W6_9SPHI|nr:SDR family oxidoreductase [Albibacterium bauzanense]TCK85675.1 NAD(P)H dehydrogenase (quinone) [Albibacterium bauzanense]